MPSGAVTLYWELERDFDSAGLDLRFVVNDVYAERVQRLTEYAGLEEALAVAVSIRA